MNRIQCEIQAEILLLKAYGLYIKNWCDERGYDVKKVRKANSLDQEYNGEMYVCLEEFQDNEFLDIDYMEFLLCSQDFALYKEIMAKVN